MIYWVLQKETKVGTLLLHWLWYIFVNKRGLLDDKKLKVSIVTDNCGRQNKQEQSCAMACSFTLYRKHTLTLLKSNSCLPVIPKMRLINIPIIWNKVTEIKTDIPWINLWEHAMIVHTLYIAKQILQGRNNRKVIIIECWCWSQKEV